MKTNTINTNSKANAVRISRIEKRNRVKNARNNFVFLLSVVLLALEPIIIDGADFVNFSTGNKVLSLSIFGLIVLMFFTSSAGILKSGNRK